MFFWAAAECHIPAYQAVTIVRQRVEPYLNAAFSKGALAGLDLKLRYVPIVMPVQMYDKYPERSLARVRLRIYDCAPHLDFELYISGNFKQQLTEYFRGISLAKPHLVKFGATPEQVAEFDQIITEGPSVLGGK